MASPENPFTGSCYCGSITYSINLSQDLLNSPTALRCNCGFCQKPTFTMIFTSPSAFQLLSPASKSDLGDYQANNKPQIHRYFCKTCGTHVFREGKYMQEGKAIEFFALNVVTLDTPQEGVNLSEWKIEYLDGKYDDKREKGTRGIPWRDGIV